jgi:opacity protein-like surface antigen
MKKLFLFVLAFTLLLSTASFAKPKFGLKVGLNLANASVSPLQDSFSKKGITSFLIGGTIEAPISESQDFALRGDVYYTQKGSKISGKVNYLGYLYNVTSKGTFDELCLAPYLIYNVSGIVENARPFIQVGPELGFVLSSTQKTDVDGGESTSDDYKDAAGTDFSLNFGAGLGLPLNNKAEVIFDLHYCLGLTDMDDSGETTVKFRSILFCIGYDFPPPGQGSSHKPKHSYY